MITAAHLIHDIKNIATSHANSNDFKASHEQILFWIEEIRSVLIGQSLAKRDDINDSWIQYINCLQLEQVDISECCEIATDCYMLRSVRQLPGTIDTYKDNWIVSVTTPYGDIISKTNTFKNRYQKYNKYTGSKASWYIKNDYLYIANNELLESVNVAGLFEHPSEVGSFVNCSGDRCWSVDSDYPVSATLATQITDIVLKTKINPLLTYSTDKLNNADGGDAPQAGATK
jgi:hypothetical protein